MSTDIQPIEATSDETIDVPAQFAVVDDSSANWVVRRIVEARAYAERCEEFARREKARALRTEEFFMFRYGDQLLRWAEGRLAEQGGHRKSVNVPAGVVGFRRQPRKIVVDDEPALIEWAKKAKPELVITIEKISKEGLNKHMRETGELPDAGVHWDEDHETFYVK